MWGSTNWEGADDEGVLSCREHFGKTSGLEAKCFEERWKEEMERMELELGFKGERSWQKECFIGQKETDDLCLEGNELLLEVFGFFGPLARQPQRGIDCEGNPFPIRVKEAQLAFLRGYLAERRKEVGFPQELSERFHDVEVKRNVWTELLANRTPDWGLWETLKSLRFDSSVRVFEYRTASVGLAERRDLLLDDVFRDRDPSVRYFVVGGKFCDKGRLNSASRDETYGFALYEVMRRRTLMEVVDQAEGSHSTSQWLSCPPLRLPTGLKMTVPETWEEYPEKVEMHRLSTVLSKLTVCQPNRLELALDLAFKPEKTRKCYRGRFVDLPCCKFVLEVRSEVGSYAMDRDEDESSFFWEVRQSGQEAGKFVVKEVMRPYVGVTIIPDSSLLKAETMLETVDLTKNDAVLEVFRGSVLRGVSERWMIKGNAMILDVSEECVDDFSLSGGVNQSKCAACRLNKAVPWSKILNQYGRAGYGAFPHQVVFFAEGDDYEMEKGRFVCRYKEALRMEPMEGWGSSTVYVGYGELPLTFQVIHGSEVCGVDVSMVVSRRRLASCLRMMYGMCVKTRKRMMKKMEVVRASDYAELLEVLKKDGPINKRKDYVMVCERACEFDYKMPLCKQFEIVRQEMKKL